MLSRAEADEIAKKTFPPPFRFTEPVLFKGDYLYQVYLDEDEYEGHLDPHRLIDGETGEVRDFSVITDGGAELAAVYAKQ